MNGNDLFASPDASATPGGKHTGPLLITNQNNLNHFLSLGYVGPLEAFGPEDNYFGDFLDAAPGRIPLFAAPVSGELINHVRRESPRSVRPVLLELDPAALPPDPVPVLPIDAPPTERPASDPHLSASAPAVALPFAAVQRIIFLSAEDRDEVLARSYEGVPPIPHDLIAVDPALAGEGGPRLENVISWLGELDETEAPPAEAFRRADREAGAVALAAHARPDLRPALLSLFTTGHAGSDLPKWFGLLSADDTTETVSTDPDALTFAVTVAVLRASSHKEWVPSEVLETVWARISDGGLPADKTELLERGVARIRSILANEEAFKPSTTQRFPALQALMLLLIRREPEALLAWDETETNAGPEAHLTAALYAGLLRGHMRLSLSLRDAETDAALGEATARRLSPLGLPERGLSALLLSANLEVEGPHRLAAVDICGFMEWRDCVTSKVIFPDTDAHDPPFLYQTQKGSYSNKKVIAYSIPGVAEVHHELDADRFKQRLRNERLPDRVEVHVRKRLAE